jgi:hypothetical protein
MDLFHPIGLRKPGRYSRMCESYAYVMARHAAKERAARLTIVGLFPSIVALGLHLAW